MKRPIFDIYVERICKFYRLTEEELFLHTITREITGARAMLYYLCIERGMRNKEIQTYLKERGLTIHHANIGRGIQSIKNKMAEDEDYTEILKQLK